MISLMPLTRGGVYPYDFFTHSKRFKKATTTTTTTRGDGDGDDDARVFYRVLPMLSRELFDLELSRDDALAFSLSFVSRVRNFLKLNIFRLHEMQNAKAAAERMKNKYYNYSRTSREGRESPSHPINCFLNRFQTSLS